MWKEYLRLIDAAPKEGSGAKGPVDPVGDDKEGKNIPKDDDAKERAKTEQETRDAKAAFAECESQLVLAVFVGRRRASRATGPGAAAMTRNGNAPRRLRARSGDELVECFDGLADHFNLTSRI